MLIALNQALRAQRRRLTLTCAAVALAASIVSAHSATGADHMGMGITVCIAVIDTALVAAAVVIIRRRPKLRLPMPVCAVLVPGGPYARRPHLRTRAGPAALQVFRR